MRPKLSEKIAKIIVNVWPKFSAIASNVFCSKKYTKYAIIIFILAIFLKNFCYNANFTKNITLIMPNFTAKNCSKFDL